MGFQGLFGFALSFLVILCFASARILAGQASSSGATASGIGTARLAWVDFEQAILRSEEGKGEFSDLQKFVDKKTTDLAALKKEAETLRNQLNVQGAKLTEEARIDLEEQIEIKETSLQRFQQDTQREIDNRRARIMRIIGKKMLSVIEKMAREKSLSGVLFLNPSLVAWIDPGTVMTDDVITAYNAAHPASSGPETPPRKP